MGLRRLLCGGLPWMAYHLPRPTVEGHRSPACNARRLQNHEERVTSQRPTARARDIFETGKCITLKRHHVGPASLPFCGHVNAHARTGRPSGLPSSAQRVQLCEAGQRVAPWLQLASLRRGRLCTAGSAAFRRNSATAQSGQTTPHFMRNDST